MIDPFVLLTPILLLGVFALVRFVGCDLVIGLKEWSHDSEITGISPQGLTPCGSFTVSGNNFVDGSTVTWDFSPALTTHFISSTELRVDVALALNETLMGSTLVTVNSPGGGTSAPFKFTPMVNPAGTQSWPMTPPKIGTLMGDVQDLTFMGFQFENFSPTGGDQDVTFTPGGISGVFSFTNGRRVLEQIVVHNAAGAPGTVTLQDDLGQPEVTMTVPPGQILMPTPTITTNWTKCSSQITVTSPLGDNLRIHSIAWRGPR